jgi:hypothetical protein
MTTSLCGEHDYQSLGMECVTKQRSHLIYERVYRIKFAMLVQTAKQDMQQGLTKNQGGLSAKQQAKIFNAKMLQGNIQGAIKYLMETKKGGVLMPDDINKKIGDLIEDVLKSKHPNA